ncbi:Rhodanese domain protein [Shewanella halifaxensis HAW-EB4]|uniref:Rhodanese domain protein n=1 Tax=Shewanella halifaxensis (strain HAW-EB4) TaxID=458817 RepID=B0TND9_SHEHH|nr:rhodanese-like domain-containing protein [Shewanella halifaxensis]ABZ76125.1 Rhodanese domain protein [Shewanella halifaxensis HAW-EB4]
MKHNPAFLALVESILPQITEVTVEQYQSMAGWDLLDVREDSEWQQGRLPNSQHLGRGIIERDIETRFPDKQSPLVLYCGGGYRSALAANNLQVMGYSKVVSLAGGYKAWLERKLPIEHD